MTSKYTIKQITFTDVHTHTNISPRDIGLWCYFIDGRAYGFSVSEEGARDKAKAAVGEG